MFEADLRRKLRYCWCRVSAVLLMMFWNTSRSSAQVNVVLIAVEHRVKGHGGPVDCSLARWLYGSSLGQMVLCLM